MRTLSKLVLLVIMVLSLSIFVQQKPGICFIVCELFLSPYVGDGVIISPKDGILPATINIEDVEWLNPDYPIPPNKCFYKGRVTIESDELKNSSDCTIVVAFTSEPLNISVDIATEEGAIFSGIISLTDDPFTVKMSLTLQIPKKGISGAFTLDPVLSTFSLK